MRLDQMSDRQLINRTKNLQNAISIMYKASCMVNGEMAQLGIEDDINRAEHELDCCSKEFERRKNIRKSTDILIAKWREKMQV